MHISEDDLQRKPPLAFQSTSYPDLPHNIEAEQAFLGALLLDNRIIERVDELEPNHFYDLLHARIFEAAAKFIRAGRLANPITLRTIFEHDQATDDLTVPQYMGRLLANPGILPYAKEYARTIIDLATRRDLIRLACDIKAAAQDSPVDTPSEDLIAEAEGRLFALAESKAERGFVPLGDALAKVLDKISDAYQRNENLAGLPTGLTDLDNRLGGLQPSDLIIIAGRPSMGKTSLALDIADHLARQGIPVGGFSLEMSAPQLGLRLVSQRVEIASERLRRGAISEEEFRAVAQRAKEVAELPLIIDETGGLSLAQLVSRARRMKRQHKIQLLVIDYLQLLHGSNRQNRTQDVTEITMGLKALAKELDIPVIALSQLSRGPENRNDKRPQLADLRESGSIEQDADVVMFVFREEYYVERERPAEEEIDKMLEWQRRMAACHGKGELIVAKNRNGPTGIIPVAFNATLTRFSNLVRGFSAEEVRHA